MIEMSRRPKYNMGSSYISEVVSWVREAFID
jgi:hypothetical protein